MDNSKKIISSYEALEKAKKFCAYSEKSQNDVRLKLKSWDIDDSSSESIISSLIEDKFINEERFARAFSRGKFTIKHWGKNKIYHELKLHQISKKCIQMGLSEIDDYEYLEVLKKEIIKKNNLLSSSKNIRLKKIVTYLMGKGFESELCWQYTKQILEL